MELHKYQEKAVKFIINTPKSFLMMEMGLGKTISVLKALDWLLYKELDINRVLIIAPKRVAEYVWSDEIKKWGLNLKTSIIKGTAKDRTKALKPGADLYLVGKENTVWTMEQVGQGFFDTLIIDESSTFKNHRSKRFKEIRKYQFNRVVLMSGTPSPNSLMDLWAQIYLLDRGERLGKHITDFRNRFFRQGYVRFTWELIAGSSEVIHKLIKDVSISMESKDYLELPGVMKNNIWVYMTPIQKRAYNEFKKEKILELEDGELTALNAAVLAGKLLQFANGAIYDENRKIHKIHDLKLEALNEIIQDDKPTLLAWSFRHDRDRILERFPHAKEIKNKKDIDLWNEGKTPLLIMHPASGGHGLNLQDGGHRIIWFSQNYSLELTQQLNARLVRQGQKNKVIIHHIVTKDTLDEKIQKVLGFKNSNQKDLLRALKIEINKV